MWHLFFHRTMWRIIIIARSHPWTTRPHNCHCPATHAMKKHHQQKDKVGVNSGVITRINTSCAIQLASVIGSEVMYLPRCLKSVPSLRCPSQVVSQSINAPQLESHPTNMAMTAPKSLLALIGCPYKRKQNISAFPLYLNIPLDKCSNEIPLLPPSFPDASSSSVLIRSIFPCSSLFPLMDLYTTGTHCLCPISLLCWPSLVLFPLLLIRTLNYIAGCPVKGSIATPWANPGELYPGGGGGGGGCGAPKPPLTPGLLYPGALILGGAYPIDEGAYPGPAC